MNWPSNNSLVHVEAYLHRTTVDIIITGYHRPTAYFFWRLHRRLQREVVHHDEIAAETDQKKKRRRRRKHDRHNFILLPRGCVLNHNTQATIDRY